MKKFIVSYASKGALFASGFYVVQAKTEAEAIQKGKQFFVNDWIWGKEDALSFIKAKNYIFFISR